MKTNSKIAFSAVGLGLAAAVAMFAIRPPASWDDTSLAFHLPLAASELMMILHLAAALLFLLSLGVYKAKLQTAFRSIVVGIVLIALGTVQLPVLDATNQWNSAYVTHGIVGLPFLISGLLLYFGAAAFGRLIGSTSVFTNKFIVFPVVTALAAASALLPHVHTSVQELSYDIGNGVLVWVVLLDLAAALVFFRVRRDIGDHYKLAMLWLGLALLGSVSCVTLGVFDNLVSTQARDSITQVLNAVTVIAGFAWLKAGYIFTNTKEL